CWRLAGLGLGYTLNPEEPVNANHHYQRSVFSEIKRLCFRYFIEFDSMVDPTWKSRIALGEFNSTPESLVIVLTRYS
ncbi:MAG: hypothetical protein ACTICQ_11560, partial [Glutamicibacter arilaitensis]|uniref:hypothetical protein n=1 Tax=Glutamicibacter arilaitensis TaxID=256701 RepID=UPI003FB83210